MDTKYNAPSTTAALFPGPDFSNQAVGNSFNNIVASFGLDTVITPNLVNQFKAWLSV